MKIENVRRMTDSEMDELGWHRRHGANPEVLELADGVIIIPAADPELNGPGYLLGQNPNGDFFGFDVDE